jgi:hypothetical protein
MSHRRRRGYRRRGDISWGDIESYALGKYGRAPKALLFVLKFHRNYFGLARLGPRPAHRVGLSTSQRSTTTSV